MCKGGHYLGNVIVNANTEFVNGDVAIIVSISINISNFGLFCKKTDFKRTIFKPF